jgi:hypothetical protein
MQGGRPLFGEAGHLVLAIVTIIAIGNDIWAI